MPEATLGTKVSGHAVVAFLSALSIALKSAGQASASPGQRDLFLLVEEEIREFFDHLLEHENLRLEDLRDLTRMREVLRGMYHDADFVMLDPSREPEH